MTEKTNTIASLEQHRINELEQELANTKQVANRRETELLARLDAAKKEVNDYKAQTWWLKGQVGALQQKAASLEASLARWQVGGGLSALVHLFR